MFQNPQQNLNVIQNQPLLDLSQCGITRSYYSLLCRCLPMPGNKILIAKGCWVFPYPSLYSQYAHRHFILGQFLDKCRCQSSQGIHRSLDSPHNHHTKQSKHSHPSQSFIHQSHRCLDVRLFSLRFCGTLGVRRS